MWDQLGLVVLVNPSNGLDEYAQETIYGLLLPDTSRNFVRDQNLTNDCKSPPIQTTVTNQLRLLQAILNKRVQKINFFMLTAMGANGSIRMGNSNGSQIIEDSFSESADEVTEDSSSLSC